MKKKYIFIFIITIFSCADNKNYYYDYYSNGKVKIKGEMINGKLNGVTIYYDSLGVIIMKSNMRDDKFHGKAIIYFPNSTIVKTINNYEDNEKIGTQYEYYKNGSLKNVSEWVMAYNGITGKVDNFLNSKVEFSENGDTTSRYHLLSIKNIPSEIRKGDDINIEIYIDGLSYDSLMIIVGDYTEYFEPKGKLDTLKGMFINIDTEKTGNNSLRFIARDYSAYKNNKGARTTKFSDSYFVWNYEVISPSHIPNY